MKTTVRDLKSHRHSELRIWRASTTRRPHLMLARWRARYWRYWTHNRRAVASVCPANSAGGRASRPPFLARSIAALTAFDTVEQVATVTIILEGQAGLLLNGGRLSNSAWSSVQFLLKSGRSYRAWSLNDNQITVLDFKGREFCLTPCISLIPQINSKLCCA